MKMKLTIVIKIGAISAAFGKNALRAHDGKNNSKSAYIIPTSAVNGKKANKNASNIPHIS